MKKITEKCKKVMIIVLVCAIVAASIILAVIFGGTAIARKEFYKFALDCKPVEYTDRVKPVFEDGGVTLKADRDLRVLQLTDVHVCGGIASVKEDRQAITAVRDMLHAVKPDLVIITGDLSYALEASCNYDNGFVYDTFARMMDKLGVYWTVAYGNHDSEQINYKTRAEISKMLTSGQYEYCVFRDEDGDAYGHGNTFYNVKNKDGVIVRSLITVDSNDYVKGGYDNIHDDQVEWYKNGIDKVNAYNANLFATLPEGSVDKEAYANVKSSMFFHIPLDEYKYAVAEYMDAGKKDTANVQYIYGELNEKVCNPKKPSKMFGAIQEKGSTDSIFVGHDHKNSIALRYKGVTLAYSYSIDCFAYSGIDKTDDYRGGTLITVKPDGSCDHRLINVKEARKALNK